MHGVTTVVEQADGSVENPLRPECGFSFALPWQVSWELVKLTMPVPVLTNQFLLRFETYIIVFISSSLYMCVWANGQQVSACFWCYYSTWKSCVAKGSVGCFAFQVFAKRKILLQLITKKNVFLSRCWNRTLSGGHISAMTASCGTWTTTARTWSRH